MSEDLNFRVSSALKDIIGQDLIPDDYIAVFELVKNTFDAHASRVDIYFIDINSSDAKIIIKDNGKGMSREDLVDKWLFVAYSAKREGTEDDNYDYRNNLYKNRPFAGAKGIGRFSCDRLGMNLRIETTKDTRKTQTEILHIDWRQFEVDLKKEFVKIKVKHDTKVKANPDHGTILEITNLRSEWDRQKLLKLKDSLAKLINPNQSRGESKFKIFLHVDDEKGIDNKTDDYRKQVNGEVKNFVFETLGLKTTKIKVTISEDGKFITTELKDGGTSIYTIKEHNKYKLLKDIEVTLYYLNRSAKVTFSKKMGLASRLYGHIFLYKNGFRIYPFGEPYEDPLKIDIRKSRKEKSRLGTGELIGQIEIFGPNPQLKETSSRGNGLDKNPTYEQFSQDFFIQCLERLEKYVIEVQKWGLSIEDSNFNRETEVSELLAELADVDDIIDFEVPNNFLEIIEASQSDSAESAVKSLNQLALKSGDKKLQKVVSQTTKKLREIQVARIEAEKLADEEAARAAQAELELEEKSSENLFLKSIKSQDFEDVLNLMHHIGISTSTIQQYIKGIVFRLENEVAIDRAEFKLVLSRINNEVSKISSISRFATKANFKVTSQPVKLDVINFLREYLVNVIKPYLPSNINLRVHNHEETPFVIDFKPLEFTILMDNLINNSRKANAKTITISFKREKKNILNIFITDNGIGIPEKDSLKIFEYGFTTTEGSGLGLPHVKEIIEKAGGKIEVNSKTNSGAEFKITLKQKA